ncbi:plexin-B3 isoform X1 [Physeter macrocephalus]|uniref:Plexin-B3 n=1 Tax=Physeter macrocephalus TaxID=9755 RepID=A0A9W2WEJ8_PHYMC|nr:plexin-B3 isoform X1 [Physeter catodon]
MGRGTPDSGSLAWASGQRGHCWRGGRAALARPLLTKLPAVVEPGCQALAPLASVLPRVECEWSQALTVSLLLRTVPPTAVLCPSPLPRETPLLLPFAAGPAMAPRPPLGACLLLVLPLLCPPLAPTRAHRFPAPNTTLNRLALAPGRGALYVGAVNRLFQLSPALRLESAAVTGPVLDSPDCVPFREPAECPQARLTDNANQLLLVSGRARELVACGQVRQGVCEKRRLEDVAQLLYRAEDPGDGQFVAANAAGVATVGLVVPGPGRDLLLVARGLAGKLSGGVPPLTVRQLAGPQPFSGEGLGRLVVGDLSDYNNSYVAALADARSAYFVFRRRGARAQAEYRSYVARVCLGDANLYSYVEVPLTCRGHGLIQAASLAPGALLGAFAAGPSGAQAALCAFPLADLDATMERARRLCYTTGGRGPGGTEEATVEYGVTSRCVTLPPDSPESYPCGDEHTPSPIAGRRPLEAGPLLQLGNSISAVAALQADGHTIAFLGDVQGQLHKVFLNGTRGQVYHSQQVGPPGSAISPDLLVDSSGSHLYVLTSQQVDRVPVAACPQFLDCSSCLQARDPLCGWCVLQGRCSRRGQCGRAAQPNQWLWSYEDGRCLHIQSLLPAQRPRQEQGQVTLSVPRLPALTVDEYFHCAFGDYDSLAHVEGTHVTCVTPPQDQLPHNPPGTEHITLPLALMFEDVLVATANFSFYDCSAVQALEAAAPCGACVGSPWRCHWCPQSSRCVYGERCPEGERTIYSAQQADIQVRGPGACPRVEGLVGPLLVPVGWESRLALRVRNLQHFRGLPASYHCWLELPGELQRLPASLEEEVAGDAGLIHCQAQQVGSCPVASPATGRLLQPLLVPGPRGSPPLACGHSRGLLGDAGPERGRPYSGRSVLGEVGGARGVPSRVGPDPAPRPQFQPSMAQRELAVPISVTRGEGQRLDKARTLHVTLYDCAVGHPDCSHCQAANGSLGCLWCSHDQPTCRYGPLCPPGAVEPLCPTPSIHTIEPLTGPPEGGLALTILGSNLGRDFADVQDAVSVAGRPCSPDPSLYRTSARIVCVTSPAPNGTVGPIQVAVKSRPPGISTQHFTYQDPVLLSLSPQWGPQAGGTQLTIHGRHLQTGGNVSAWVGSQPCRIREPVCPEAIVCHTTPQASPGEAVVRVVFGRAQRTLLASPFHYTTNPRLVAAEPSVSFRGGGRLIRVRGTGLDVVERPLLSVWLEAAEETAVAVQPRDPTPRRSCRAPAAAPQACTQLEGGLLQCSTACSVSSSSLLLCRSPAVPDGASPRRVFFALDNVHVDFARASGGQDFLYQPNPRLAPLSRARPYRLKPGHILDVEGEGLNLGISKEEVRVHVGDGECVVKTLTLTHLYCEPPPRAPRPADGSRALPQLVVQMGNVRLPLGPVQYEAEPALSAFPVEAQVGLGLGVAVLIAAVLLLTLMYRHKSKQALRDYQKVLVQLENLEIGVGDQCRKEFTDLMTEMTDLSSDLEASGIPFLDYHTYAERVFFPGRGSCPLQPALEGPAEEGRRAPVRQGLTQLSNLLNSKLFLLTLIHTLEEQPGFSQRDRCLVASLLSLALHGKLEYLTDIVRTLLGDLAARYVQKNPKLMLRRTETMAEKLLTNWVSICLYAFLREVAGEPLYVLLRAIQYQVDKGPVDAVTGKAKRTLNDSRLLREDVEFRPLTLMLLAGPGAGGAAGGSAAQRVPARVLDTDTITQVKEKVLDQVYKGTPFSQRPSVHALDLGENLPLPPRPRLFSPVAARLCPTGTGCGLSGFPGSPQEWRSGLAGHLTLSDEDLTSVTQNRWKRLNTLQHYKVPGRWASGAGSRLGVGQGRSPASAPLPARSRMEPRCGSFPGCTTEAPSPRARPRAAPQGRVSPVAQPRQPAPEIEAARPEPCSRRPPCPGLPRPRQRGSHKSRLSRGPGVDEGGSASGSGSSRAAGCWAERAPGPPPCPPHLSYPAAPGAAHPAPRHQGSRLGLPGQRHEGAKDRGPAPVPSDAPMLEDSEEGGVRLWHLVKVTDEPEAAKARRSSLRERERERARAKAIPEIYLTRLLSMKGTLQKFVDDAFQAILSVNRPVPIAVKYLFDFLDELAEKHGIEDLETLHIWKTNSLLLRFWVNTLKNPQLVFDVRVSDNVDAILAVIAQTFMDSCTVSEHKVGRDSPVNKLLYAREIPRYKQMVERYYSDIRQSSPASYQEMNSALAELSGNYTSAPHCLEALQELYTHIHRYYDQIISALEEDPVGQKMQLACRLQQIAALVENKVTDL